MIIDKIKNSIDEIKKSNLLSRSLKGAIWIGSGNVTEQGSRFIRNMILTRLLAPEVFGLMAIVLAVNDIFDSFTEVGIKQAVIQHPEGENKLYLNGAWWLSLVRSFSLYLIAFFLSPYVATFYDDSNLTPLLRFAFIGVFFRGLISPLAYTAVKKMKFGRWVLLYHGGGVIGVILAVILAFQIKSVWALVIGFTAESFFRFLLSYVFFPFVPGLRFKRDYSIALFKFSRGVIGLPILTFVFYRADIFVIGKTCTKHDLGLYSMAATLALIPTQLFSVLISELALPLFSKIQNDYKSLNRALISMTQIIAYFGFPLTFFLVCYSEQLLAVTYGEKYRFVAIPFAIISIKSFFLLCSIPLAGLYFALGKPEKHRLFTIARALLIIILIYPFVNILGLVGAAIAGLLSLAVSFFLQLRQMKHLIELNLYKYNNILLKAFLFSLILPAVRMSTFSISTNSYVTHLVIGLSVFTIVSVFVLYYFHRSLISQKTR